MTLQHVSRANAAETESPPAAKLTEQQRQLAVSMLRKGLRADATWVKVHAAEFLLALSYPQGVVEEFTQELAAHGEEPQVRTGIWRVLARAASTPQVRDDHLERIKEAARNPQAPDRLHAIEALAKLGAPLDPAAVEDVRSWVDQAGDVDAPFGHWLLVNSVEDAAQRQLHMRELARLLGSSEPLARLRAAFALSQLKELPQSTRLALTDAAIAAQNAHRDEESAALADAYVLISAWQRVRRDGDGKAASRLRGVVSRRAASQPAVAVAYTNALAEVGDARDLPSLMAQLAEPDADLAVSAAHAALRIERRVPHRLATLDWWVIAGYALAMLGIGAYYSRRTSTAEEYLLGGRSMSPIMVGISLFATLLSTLTYLAMPGEMIRYGPMVLAGIAAFPLVAWVVGWSMIPFFMRLRATTAYEILETRYGYGGRVLGSLMFLMLRLFWMAVIIYKTTEIVLMPLFGLPLSTTPWVCAAVGVITVVYSSMGGLRAVVMTDVVQSAILLGGAMLTMAVITVRLGGFAQWWPQTWNPSWEPLRWGFDPSSPRTVAAAVMAYFVWFICTSGSDQMAVQRYLATKDASAARRMFILSLAVNALSTTFLGIVGFALLGYYQRHPEALSDGQTIASQADGLFTRFIVAGLPAGVSGIVVAGLLAAAMSSLSSGINSSCSIISVDYLNRWRRTAQSPRAYLRQTILVSWVVGLLTVLLSTFVGMVEGNLLEVIHKVVNLLVAPLFVLFFMAMYVPRASSAAAYLAVLASVAGAVAVAFYEVGGMGVLWIMPVSLAAGILVGGLFSLILNRPSQ